MWMKRMTAVSTLVILAGLALGTQTQAAPGDPNIGTNALFIEAEDFNFSDDGTIGGLHANFGDPDCSLTGKDALLGVDYFEVNDNNESPNYRAPAGVETRPETGDSARGNRTITCDYVIGWNDAGDWFNYTRDFGAPARYNVYARLASGGPSMNAELARIHGDPAGTNQTSEVLGTFASPSTGGWNIFQYVPLRDAEGNLVSVPLEGFTTLRFTVLPETLDFNYLVFVKAESNGAPTRVTSVEPPANSVARAPLIRATLADGDIARVVPSSIRLTFDGTDVTASSTIVDTDTGAEISYQAPAGSPAGTLHTVRVDWTDDSPAPRMESFAWNYTEGSNTTAQNLFIEAEDFNFSDDGITGGLHANFGDPDCSLAGKDALLTVDYFEVNDHNESPEYRAPTGVETRPEFSDSARGDRTITCDYVVGWNEAGDWYNYTRDFGPPARYNVYARLASGGLSMSAELARIHGDPTGTNQIKEVLGTFASPSTGGWNVFHDVPLRDDVGNLVSVPLEGLTTLRFTVLPGALDFNYLLFVEAQTQGTPTRVTSVEPPPNSVDARAPLIVATLADGDIARVVPSSIKLTFDGTDVTASSAVVDTDTGAQISYQAAEGSPAGTVHTVRVDWADDSPTPRMESFTWSYTEGINNAQTNLFIEAEDFNYSDDGITGGLHANFGDSDCSLAGKDAVLGVDYFDVIDQNESPEYRAPTGVGTRPEFNDSARGNRAITCDYVVGWNFTGNWYNYTRNFGGSARYNVYARLASGGDPMNAELARIHGDPAGTNQTKEVLGTFGAPATGSWNVFHYVPLRDGQGNFASVRLEGLTTLRFTVLPGALDFNYLLFVKADVQEAPTRVTSVEPRADSDYARAPLITATLTDGDIVRVVPSSIKLTFDGTDVTAGSTIVDTDSGAKISYQAPAGSPTGTVHTVRVDWTDDSPTPRMESFTWNYTEGIYNAEKNLFIEMEDFNTASGVALPSFGRVPFNAKGLYNTLGATTGIDFNDSGNFEGDVYRNGEVPNVGMVPVDDAYKGGAGPRPGFDAVPDYKIGWADPSADWYNYTRNYRAGGTYEIYLRASQGDIFATIGGRLELIDDPSSATPGKTLLGTFSAPATGGWDTFTFVPLRDANGEIARVRLQGVRTLRFTVDTAFSDLNYLMLCPIGP